MSSCGQGNGSLLMNKLDSEAASASFPASRSSSGQTHLAAALHPVESSEEDFLLGNKLLFLYRRTAGCCYKTKSRTFYITI